MGVDPNYQDAQAYRENVLIATVLVGIRNETR